jgi:hypothetical protein
VSMSVRECESKCRGVVVGGVVRGACGMWHVACGVWRVACGVWRVGCGVWGVACGGVACGVWRVACDVWRMTCGRCVVWVFLGYHCGKKRRSSSQ